MDFHLDFSHFIWHTSLTRQSRGTAQKRAVPHFYVSLAPQVVVPQRQLAGTLLFLFNDNYLSQMERSAEFNTLRGNIATQFAAFAYLLRQWALPLWLNIDPDLPLFLALATELALLLNTRTFRIGNYSGTAAFLLPLAG